MSRPTGIRDSFLVKSSIIAALILVTMQATTLERAKLLLIENPEATVFDTKLSERAPLIIASLSWTDWALISALVALAVWLVLRELRGRRLSSELEWMLQSERATITLLAAMAVVISRFYLAPGQFSLGDALCHTSRVWAAAKSLEGGHWPSWSFLNYCGFPLLQFYGPLFFVLAGALSLVMGSTQAATKTLIFLFHAGSAFPVYFWAKAIGASRRVSLIAAVAYIISFQHTHAVTWAGFLPVSLVYVLFPLLLLGTEEVLGGSSRRWLYVVAGASAALVLCHQQYAAYGLQLMILYLLARWILSGPARPRFRQVAAVALCSIAGVLLCAFFLVPSLAEREWVYFPGWLPLIRLGVPSAEFSRAVFMWRNVWSGWNYAYIGITIVALAVFGGWSAWRRASTERADYIIRAIVVVAVIAFIGASRTGRLMHVVLPFVALLCGAAARYLRRASPHRVTLFVVALLFLDLGPTTIQSPYRLDREFLRTGLREAADRINPHRTLLGYTSRSGTHFFAWAYTEDSDLMIPVGSFPQGAPRSLNSVTAMTDALNLAADSLASVRLDFLYLWDVAGLVTNRRDRFVPPEVDGLTVSGGEPPIAWMDHSSPLLYSECLAVAADDSLHGLDRMNLVLKGDLTVPERQTYLRRMALWVGAMGIERPVNRARCIFLSDGQDLHAYGQDISDPDSVLPRIDQRGYARDGSTGDVRAPGPVEAEAVTIDDFAVDMRHVGISYHAVREGYLRLAFSWYPTLRVLVDGEPASPLRSVFGAIVVPTEAGEHRIELVPSRSKGHLPPVLIATVLGALTLCSAIILRDRNAV